MFHRTESGSTEVFTLTEDDFIKPYLADAVAVHNGRSESGDWRAEAMREVLGRDPKQVRMGEIKEAAGDLAGVYWWSCFPGCLPDSDAFGPFASEDEALEDAIGD